MCQVCLILMSYYLITISLMPAHIMLFEVIERVFVESLYEPENVREVNLSIIFINVTSLPLSSISIKILYKNMFLADVDPYIIIETYVVLLISLILKENESALAELMYVLLFYIRIYITTECKVNASIHNEFIAIQRYRFYP